MNVAINVYEYGRGGKCSYMFRYAYAGIREMKKKMKMESRHMCRVIRTSIGTVTLVLLDLRKRKRKQKSSHEYTNTKHTYEYGCKCMNMNCREMWTHV